MIRRGHSQTMSASHHGQNTRPQFLTAQELVSSPSSFSAPGALDPAIKAIACTFIGVGAAVVLARISFWFF